jgi:hypothetical protein
MPLLRWITKAYERVFSGGTPETRESNQVLPSACPAWSNLATPWGAIIISSEPVPEDVRCTLYSAVLHLVRSAHLLASLSFQTSWRSLLCFASSQQATENFDTLLIEVPPPFQQLKAAVPHTRAQAIAAGVQISCVNSSATIDFECCADHLAVVKDGVRLFADLLICCGPVVPSLNQLQTLQLTEMRARVMQKEHFAVIASSNRQSHIEIMLQRLLLLRNKVPQLNPGSRQQSQALPTQNLRYFVDLK